MEECGFEGPIDVVTFPMPDGLVFDWHTHDEHQLAWAASGVLTIRSADLAWVLPPTRAMWIPAGVRHETLSERSAVMRSAYVKTDACPSLWTVCTPVVATRLLTELVAFLEQPDLAVSVRTHAMAMLFDVLEPASATSIDVRMPAEERARKVADALSRAPGDDRTLSEWGSEVGASSRTLARAFLADTGLTFGRWRSLLRLHTAIGALAEGQAVTNVAALVGYESTSAFVSAFRRATGVTPGSYFSATD